MERRVVETNNNNNRKRPPPPPPPPIVGVIACRTRSKKKAMEATWNLPIPIIIEILNWLDQESLMNTTLVSKQLHKIICNGHGIENKKFPMIEINPTNGSTITLLQNLHQNQWNIVTNNKIRHCLHMKVNNGHDFDYIPSDQIQAITTYAQMDWILSLDISLPMRIGRVDDMHSLLSALWNILPNLLELDISDTCGCGLVMVLALNKFSNHCPYLEKITWNNIMRHFVLDGGGIVSSSNNLRVIIMDDSVFYCSQSQLDQTSDLKNHRDQVLFVYCSKVLERVSIRNAKWCYINNDNNDIIDVVPQNALIKFVRNAPPTLRWFRSDLNQDNMTMLRLERPEIELLNY
jgi:hypothetical protein